MRHSQPSIASNGWLRGPTRVHQEAENCCDAKARKPQTAVLHYGSRHWAIYLNGQLLAVTVYKKGGPRDREALGPTSSE
jgi:hypothetical protein